jgi:hypothetical protein
MTRLLNGRFWLRIAPQFPLLLEAFCHLIVAKAAVGLLPFTLLSKLLSTPSVPVGQTSGQRIDPVCWSVSAVARHPTTWAVCLPQAIAGHWMLRRRGIASVVCFGVGRDPEAKLGAHAWLRVADRVVLGQRAMAGFTPIAEFPGGSPLTEQRVS